MLIVLLNTITLSDVQQQYNNYRIFEKFSNCFARGALSFTNWICRNRTAKVHI